LVFFGHFVVRHCIDGVSKGFLGYLRFKWCLPWQSAEVIDQLLSLLFDDFDFFFFFLGLDKGLRNWIFRLQDNDGIFFRLFFFLFFLFFLFNLGLFTFFLRLRLGFDDFLNGLFDFFFDGVYSFFDLLNLLFDIGLFGGSRSALLLPA